MHHSFVKIIHSLGKKRLRLEDEECYLFEEEDGTEIEDDLCLLEYDKCTLFVLGSKWIPSPAGSASKSSEAFQTHEKNTGLQDISPQEHPADLFPQDVDKGKTEELAQTSWPDVKNETSSREEDKIFCKAETSQYTIMRIWESQF